MEVTTKLKTEKLRTSSTALIVVICIVLAMVNKTNELKHRPTSPPKEWTENRAMSSHKSIVKQFYRKHRYWNLSKLGNAMYKTVDRYPEIKEEKKNKTFQILIWKYWDWLKKRHVYSYGNQERDPLEGCSVNNCIFTGDDSSFKSADAVVVHLQRGEIPSSKNRNPKQRWIFLTDEAPGHTFTLSKRAVNLSELYDVFNWSMTYRSDADVPVPYGRTIGLREPKIISKDPPIENLIPYWSQKRQDVLVAILISNCGVSYRMHIIERLQNYISVDVHGKCGKKTDLKKSCPGHFRADCDEMSSYLFYLALENSKCQEYMTEKLFHNAYSRGSIPIIQGPSIEDCQNSLPPNSYIHVDNFQSLKGLARHIINVSKNMDKLLYYHQWRNHFEVLNEHGFFKTKSYHLCRVCEAMNYNDDGYSVYADDRIEQFLNRSLSCRT